MATQIAQVGGGGVLELGRKVLVAAAVVAAVVDEDKDARGVGAGDLLAVEQEAVAHCYPLGVGRVQVKRTVHGRLGVVLRGVSADRAMMETDISKFSYMFDMINDVDRQASHEGKYQTYCDVGAHQSWRKKGVGTLKFSLKTKILLSHTFIQWRAPLIFSLSCVRLNAIYIAVGNRAVDLVLF